MVISNDGQPAGNEPTEESPLLTAQGSEVSQPSNLSRIIWFQRAHLVLPVVFFSFLAGTQSVQILRIVACRFWWSKNDPSRIPPSGNIPDELCAEWAVMRLLFQLLQWLFIVDFCGGLITFSPIGTLSAKFGRKPLLIGVAAIGAVAPLILIAALRSVSITFIFAALVLASIGGPRQLYLLSTMFIVDSTDNPAPVLSILEGARFLSYALGGFATTWSGSRTYVLWIQAIICATILLYVVVAIPESFGQGKRAARAAEVEAERARGRGGISTSSSRSWSASLERVRDTVDAFARPFVLIWPRRDSVTGKRNKRLLLLSVGILISLLGTTYIGPVWLVFLTSQFRTFPPEPKPFYVLNHLSAAKTIYLFFILPAIFHWGRPIYYRRRRTTPETDTDSLSSRFDVNVLAISWFIDATAIASLAFFQSMWGLTAWVMLMSIGSGTIPCISAIVAASVEPLARGEALSAITLVCSVAEFLSPMLLAWISNNTINTRHLSQTVFFVAAISAILGAGIVSLIREVDKYVSLDDRLQHDGRSPSGVREAEQDHPADGAHQN